jgi:transposase
VILPRPSTAKQGHDVRLIAAQFMKPFVKSDKNDFVDAEGSPGRPFDL